MSLGSNEAIKHAVAAGLGVAVISRLAVDSSLAPRNRKGIGIAVLDVARFPIRRSWSVVWRRDQPQTLAARRFVEYLAESRKG
jgi:DNA-binding transcriptional LysR family regulator